MLFVGSMRWTSNQFRLKGHILPDELKCVRMRRNINLTILIISSFSSSAESGKPSWAECVFKTTHHTIKWKALNQTPERMALRMTRFAKRLLLQCNDANIGCFLPSLNYIDGLMTRWITPGLRWCRANKNKHMRTIAPP